MEFIRKIVELNQLRSMMDIPESFQYKKVELLIIPLVDEIQKKELKFKPKKFFGVSHIPDVEEKIKEMRDEWDRE